MAKGPQAPTRGLAEQAEPPMTPGQWVAPALQSPRPTHTPGDVPKGERELQDKKKTSKVKRLIGIAE